MNAQVLLNHLHDNGFFVQSEGDGLMISPASALTDEIRMLIKQHKPDILKIFTDYGPANDPPPLTVKESIEVNRWLDHIEESNLELRVEVIAACDGDMNHRKFFLSQAMLIPNPEPSVTKFSHNVFTGSRWE